MLSNHQGCLICGGSFVHYNLGVQICRGCASFWRRSRGQNLQYFCQNNKNCKLELVGERRKCKACRYEQCKKLGIVEFEPSTKVGRKSYRKHTLPTLQSPTTSTDKSHKNNFIDHTSILLNTPRSPKVLENLSKKSYTTVLSQLENIRQNNLYSFLQITNQIPCLSSLETSIKLKIIKKSMFGLENLYRAYLTSINFFDVKDKRIALSHDCYLNLNDLSIFPLCFDTKLTNRINEQFIDELSSLSNAWLKKFEKFVCKFKKMQMGKEDLYALIKLSIIKQFEQMNLKLDHELNDCRNNLISQWNSCLTQQFGRIQASTKIAQFILLSCDNENINIDQKHLKIVTKLRLSILFL